MAERDLVSEVREFLVAYNEAFLVADGVTIARFYHSPCVTVRGDGSVHSFQSKQEMEKFFGGVAEKYKSDGLHGGDFYDLQLLPIGARSLLATVRWEQWRKDKSPIRQWKQSYNLIQTESGWQILTSTFHLS